MDNKLFLKSLASKQGLLKEGVARKEHAGGDWHLLKTHGNSKMVFASNEWVGTIDFVSGSNVVPGAQSQYVAKINGQYKDSRLKISRPVERTVGSFKSEEAAVAALKQAIENLRK